MRYINQIIHAALAVAVVVLGFMYFGQKRIVKIDKPPSRENQIVPERETTTNKGLSEDKVQELINNAVATLSAQPVKTSTPTEKVAQTQPTSTNTNKSTTYVNLGTTHSSSSRDWKTIEGTGSYIDVANDYGQDAYIEFVANIKIAHGNGTAYARLFDDTNKIAVSNSELKSVNNSEYKYVSSPRLYLWQGRNLYKLQIKSENGFEASVNNARIKISY